MPQSPRCNRAEGKAATLGQLKLKQLKLGSKTASKHSRKQGEERIIGFEDHDFEDDEMIWNLNDDETRVNGGG